MYRQANEIADRTVTKAAIHSRLIFIDIIHRRISIIDKGKAPRFGRALDGKPGVSGARGSRPSIKPTRRELASSRM